MTATIDTVENTSTVLTVTEILAAIEWSDLRERLVRAQESAVLARTAAAVLTAPGRDDQGFKAKGLTVALELFDSCAEADFMDFAFKLDREIAHADYVPAKLAGVLKARALMKAQALITV